MKHILSLFLFVFLFAGVASCPDFTVRSLQAADTPEQGVPQELDAYLARNDNSYRWEIIETDNAGMKSWLLELTSQEWHGIVWKHYLLVVMPEKPRFPDAAVLLINGGRLGQKPGKNDGVLAKMLADQIGCCFASLYQVPNQPLLGNHVEDALIGETLLKAIAEEDTTWPLLFPMVKSAIKAMDATQELLEREANRKIERFVVAGASKRGWTTWLTAASGDKRVVAIAPVVIDMLNIRKQMEYQRETWGDWSASIHDYTSRGLIEQDAAGMSPFKRRLWEMIDPYTYRSRLALPKLLVHGTNDPYWTVDASHLYWDDLPGLKYIATFPNVGHGLGDERIRAYHSIAVFIRHAFSGGDWPEVNWENTTDEKTATDILRARVNAPMKRVKLWSAVSATKDFRKATWTSSDIITESPENVTATIKRPATGHIAYYLEFECEIGGAPFTLTTQVWRR